MARTAEVRSKLYPKERNLTETVQLEVDGEFIVFEATETPPSSGLKPTGKKNGVVTRKLGEALEPLRLYAQGVAEKIKAIDPKPEEVEVTVGVSVTGEAGVVFAKAETTGQMEVKLKWTFKE